MTSLEAAPPTHVAPDRIFRFDIYSDMRLGEDLHATYRTLHDDAPSLFWTPANGGHWIATRADEIAEIVRRPESFSVREAQIPRIPNPPKFIPLSLDPPENIPYRKALMPFFSPKAVAQLEPRIRHFAASLVDEVLTSGRCDFVVDIGSRFPVSVFMELMGMPLEKLREFKEIADQYFRARTAEEYGDMSGRIIALMTELIELRRAEPCGDLVSEMVGFEIEGRPISIDELQSMALLLFLGGMDTVANMSAYLYRHLAADPALQARIAADSSLIPQFVEEGLRCFGVINTPRIIARDCEHFGVRFKKDEMLLCLLPIAGRDNLRHAEPDRFDIDRRRKDHLTFSSGPHLCIGHNLARLELRILTEEWIRRIPSFRWSPGHAHSSRHGMVLALETLPLEWDR